MKILARHKDWVAGATISESVNESGDIRRFVATIRGFQNWVIWEGNSREIPVVEILRAVNFIRDRIDAGDEEIFKVKGRWLISEIVPGKFGYFHRKEKSGNYYLVCGAKPYTYNKDEQAINPAPGATRK